MKRAVQITVIAISVVLCLSLLSAYGQERQQRRNIRTQRLDVNMVTLLIRLMDLNRDGRISGGEYMQFFINTDQNNDGFIEQQDIITLPYKEQQEEVNTAKKPTGPRIGQISPDFVLQALDGTGTVTLSDYKKKRKPVVLVFASYTWQPFRDQAGTLEKLYNKYKSKSEWLLIYLREIRPSDSQQVGANTVAETGIGQLETMEDRMSVARNSYSQLGISFPAVVDNMDNKTEEVYAAWPDRIYIVDKNGMIAYRSKEGPEGFKPLEMERKLAKLCKN